MKIENLTTKNFLGLSSLSIDVTPGVTLIAGPNGAGKTSVLDGIRFALLGERLRGLRHKADMHHLVTQGAKDGFVSITVDGKTYKRSVKNGEYASSGPMNLPEALQYVLDAQRFASMPQDDRRKFLYGLMRVETSHTAVGKLLVQADVAQAVCDEVLPMLRGGFEVAEKYAVDQAAQARGAWKAVTGETYGDKKADAWSPKAGSVSDDARTDTELQTVVDSIPAIEQRNKEAIKALGTAEAQAKAQANPELETARARLPGWKEKLVIGSERETALRAEVKSLRAKAVESGGVYIQCPCCGETLLLDRGNLKLAHAPAGGQLQASEQLAEAQAELNVTTTAVDKLKTNIALAERMITAADASGQCDPQALSAAAQAAETELRQAYLARTTLDLRTHERAQVQTKIKQAALHHEAVQAWKLCAEQLAPAGIPSTLLAQALFPVNMQLGSASDMTDWPRVSIAPDMGITYDGRAYTLCSESERWRADAMISDALARLSGLNLLLLDRLDVLDTAGRSAALSWLLEIAPNYETIIVGATLKTAPQIEGLNAIWLDDANTGRKAA